MPFRAPASALPDGPPGARPSAGPAGAPSLSGGRRQLRRAAGASGPRTMVRWEPSAGFTRPPSATSARPAGGTGAFGGGVWSGTVGPPLRRAAVVVPLAGSPRVKALVLRGELEQPLLENTRLHGGVGPRLPPARVRAWAEPKCFELCSRSGRCGRGG
ncbi:unnamed protein product [Prorocentrum cordatum]|uniref:Uncharacterized protein n=1 Tax=Prorocentrum cordatum TaxID=2364126 RepID=A0ABN9TP16_9DINO|nr:unnamed protein product [Polarella glacialis]